MRYLLPLLFLLPLAASAQLPKAEHQIREILAEQAAAWNRGDLDAFMADYWQSPQLQFIGSRGLTTGWQATLDNYRRSYPDRATMGTLSFDVLDVTPRSRKVVTVVGRWKLQRAADAPAGYFLLVWQKKKGRWRIVADHSS